MKRSEFKHLLLASVLIHLVFETVVTFYIRYFIYNVIDRIKNGPIKQFWDNNYEYEDIPKKLDFFYFTILSADEKNKSIIKETKIFYKKLASLRNKIVHGHEVSIKEYKDGKIEKSKLAQNLDAKKLDELYNEFLPKLKNFLSLFILANSILPKGEGWKEEFIREVFVEEPLKKLKKIEESIKQYI